MTVLSVCLSSLFLSVSVCLCASVPSPLSLSDTKHLAPSFLLSLAKGQRHSLEI